MAHYDGTATYDSGARYDEPASPRTKMSKLKRDLKRDPIPNKTTRGTEIVTACTGNAAIGAVSTELTAFTTANNSLKTAATTLATAQAAVTSAVTGQDSSEQTWNATFETLCLKLEGNTTGDKAKLSTTTIPTYEPGAGAPTPGVAQVTGLSVSIGDMPHELDLQWNAMRNPRAKVFLVRRCTGIYDPASLVQIGTPSASKFTAKALVPGTVYWFDVIAVFANEEQGPPSDPATGRAV